jgi:4-hydroxy-tetrahydrodipicolinate reductase
MYRVLLIGLGPLGTRIGRELIERGVGDLVGAVDTAPELAALPVSKLVPGADQGLAVVPALDAFGRWDVVDAVIVATSSTVRACAPTFAACLREGKAVVSTCEELVWPWLREPGLARELDVTARRFGGRLLGTGVNPGFLMDALPVFLTAVCSRVEHVRVERVQDASARRIPFQRKIGAGLTIGEFKERLAAGGFGHVGLGESVHLLAHCTGLSIARWEERIEPVRADRELPGVGGEGRIRPGMVAGIEQTATAWDNGGEPVIEMLFHAAIGAVGARDRTIIRGEPSLEMVMPGGVHGDAATCAIAVNAIASLLSAEPGLHTMASVPLVHHAPGRTRGLVPAPSSGR